MDSALFKAIKLTALRDVAQQTPEYTFRYILRWYSKTFHTPLHLVMEEVPIEEVLRAYFEERFEALEPEELERTIHIETMTDAEREAATLEEELEEAEVRETLRELKAHQQQVQKTITDLEEFPEEGFSMTFDLE